MSDMCCCGNAITIGGVLLERESGRTTQVGTLVRYSGLTEEHVNEFWDFYTSNEKVLAATEAYERVVAAELMAWGKERAKTKA